MSKRKSNLNNKSDLLALAVTFILVLAFCVSFSFVTNHFITDSNPYNTYEIQAQSWLDGRVDVDNREWLELATYNGKYYVSFPPLPSVILLPFVAVFGSGCDNYIAFIALLLGVFFCFKLSRKFGLSPEFSALVTSALYLGTNMRQITSDAWVWFFAQNLAFLFTILSFYCAKIKKKGFSMLFLACAVGCRPFDLIYLPLILLIILDGMEEKSFIVKFKKLVFEKIWVYIPAFLIVLFYCIYNYVRFGNIFEFGHNYLPEFLNSEDGQFSLSYFIKNLPCLFRLPTVSQGKITFPQFDGMSIFLVIPFFITYPLSLIVSFVRDKKIEYKKYHILGSVLILFHIFILLCHKTMGGAHFGNRYIMDTVPCLFVLSVLSFKQSFKSKNRLTTAFNVVCAVVFVVGVLINFIGTAEFYN